MNRFEPTPPWESHEILLRDADGRLHEDCKRPFAEELLSDPASLATVLNLIWMVQFHGWPKAKRVMRDEHGKNRIVLSDDERGSRIWILKAKSAFQK